LSISKLAEALENKDFDSFGAQVMDSLYYKYGDPKTPNHFYQFRGKPETNSQAIKEEKISPHEGYIHNLLVQTFKSKWEHNYYFYMNEYEFKGPDLIYLIR
jgi:hypothetical protein